MTFAQKIVSRITVPYNSITVVKNPDGFLATDAVVSWLLQTENVRVVSGSQLAIRVDYELHGKASEDKIVYLCNQPDSLLPDMRRLPQITFSLSDLFPLLPDKQSLSSLAIPELELLFARQGIKRISLIEQQTIIASIKQELEETRKRSLETFKQRIEDASAQIADWSNLHQSIDAASAIVMDAARLGMYESIEPLLQPLNTQFQHWVDSLYFAELNANPILRPHSVNKILLHLDSAYKKEDKLALVVVDGFAYWQYLILKNHLSKAELQTQDQASLAWLPTITMLSRQAIFRGDVPHTEYQQCPPNERKLWMEHWTNKGFSSYEIQYLYDTDEFSIPSEVKRLALVTVELDEKMHSSTDYRDLYALTENWCLRFIRKIQIMRDAGFAIILTTDHGSLFSHGIGSLSAQEKIYLYKDGSRGKRHLMYNDSSEQERFYREHIATLALLKHDNYLVIRNNECFDRQGATEITHGGSHWMELVIPFVKIL